MWLKRETDKRMVQKVLRQNIAASRNKSFPYFKRTYKTNKMERLEKYSLKTSFDDIFTLNFVFLHVLVFMEVIN